MMDAFVGLTEQNEVRFGKRRAARALPASDWRPPRSDFYDLDEVLAVTLKDRPSIRLRSSNISETPAQVDQLLDLSSAHFFHTREELKFSNVPRRRRKKDWAFVKKMQRETSSGSSRSK